MSNWSSGCVPLTLVVVLRLFQTGVESGWGLHRGHFDQPQFSSRNFRFLGGPGGIRSGFSSKQFIEFLVWGDVWGGVADFGFHRGCGIRFGFSKLVFWGPHFLEVLTPIWGNPFHRNAS